MTPSSGGVSEPEPWSPGASPDRSALTDGSSALPSVRADQAERLRRAGVGISSRPFPPLGPGESITRVYVTDLAAVRAVVRGARGTAVFLVVAGMVCLALGFVSSLGGSAAAADTLLIFGGLIALFVGATRLGPPYGIDPARPADVVYLTNQRVLLDQGNAWETRLSMPLSVVSDVVLWQTRRMRKAGLAWAYVMPMGASRVETMVDGELRPAPGVLEVQNLAIRDSEELRSSLIGAQPVPPEPSPR